MIEVRQTAAYEEWFDNLRDTQAKARILARIRRLSLGNFGDAKSVGVGLLELRIDCGPGYRVYIKRVGDRVVVLLAAGDKSSQERDIERARRLARDLGGE